MTGIPFGVPSSTSAASLPANPLSMTDRISYLLVNGRVREPSFRMSY
jgi:hypothetical protein